MYIDIIYKLIIGIFLLGIGYNFFSRIVTIYLKCKLLYLTETDVNKITVEIKKDIKMAGVSFSLLVVFIFLK